MRLSKNRIVHGPGLTRLLRTATYAYQAPTMVPIEPGNPITKANMIATLSLVSNPCPPALLPPLPTLLVGKALIVEVLAVELCGLVIVAVALAIEISGAARTDEDGLEELTDVEELVGIEGEEVEEEELLEELLMMG